MGMYTEIIFEGGFKVGIICLSCGEVFDTVVTDQIKCPYCGYVNLYEEKQRGDFTIKQSYDKEPPATLICIKCGGDNFVVGQGAYFTAIKCPVCGWEKCIHDG